MTITVIAVVIVLILALIGVEVAHQVLKSNKMADQRSLDSWVAAASPMISQSNTLVSVVSILRDHPSTLSRRQLEALIDDLNSVSATSRQDFYDLDLAPPSPKAAALLGQVLTARSTGALAFGRGINAAMSPPSPQAVATIWLDRSASDFRIADQAYRALRKTLRHSSSRLSAAQWIANPQHWSQSALSNYALGLSHIPSLFGHRQISLIAISFSPPPIDITGLPTPTTSVPTASTSTTTTTTPSGAATPGSVAANTTTTTTTTTTIPTTTTTLQLLPASSVSRLLPTSSIGVDVVISNTGDLVITGGSVEVVIRPRPDLGSVKPPFHESINFGALATGASRYLSFHKLSVRSGHSYTLSVDAKTRTGEVARNTVAFEIAS